MILSVISWYRLVLSEKDLWEGVGWGMRGSPRRAGESLSLACCTRHGPGTALFLSLFRRLPEAFPGGPKSRVDPQSLRQRSLPVRAETSPPSGGKWGTAPRAKHVERGPSAARETPKG